MESRPVGKLILVTVLAAGMIIAGLWTARRLEDDEDPASGQTAVISLDAPVPVAPVNGAEFVSSEVELQWTWESTLTAQQVYSVRVWVADQDQEIREIWLEAAAFDAQAVIDSFAQATGDFHWQVAVINTGTNGEYVSMGSAWSEPQTLHRVRRLSLTPLPVTGQSAAARLVGAHEYDTRAARIDAVRDFVWSHSSGESQDDFAPDYSDALQMMVDHANGTGPLPDLLCSGQATAALTLLRELGLEARLIFLYADDSDSVIEHTMLEVFNPDTQYWELHDILKNRFFVDDAFNRASIERLVFGSLDSIRVCASEDVCAPLLESAYPFRGIFEAFRYGHSDTFWVNPDRFDVTKRFPTNADRNLAEYLTGDPRDFVFRFDSWRTTR